MQRSKTLTIQCCLNIVHHRVCFPPTGLILNEKWKVSYWQTLNFNYLCYEIDSMGFFCSLWRKTNFKKTIQFTKVTPQIWREGSNCTHKRDVGRLANWLLSLTFGTMNNSPNFSLTELSFCCSVLQCIRSCWLWKIQMWVGFISRACLPTELWKTPIRQVGENWSYVNFSRFCLGNSGRKKITGTQVFAKLLLFKNLESQSLWPKLKECK